MTDCGKVIGKVHGNRFLLRLPFFIYSKNTNNENKYIYIDSNGKSIEYYLDDEGFPFAYYKGTKVYLLLPLESLRITDEEELAKLNASINDFQSYENDINAELIKSTPTSYYNLTTLPVTQNSPAYVQFMTFETSTSIMTQTLKVHASHPMIRVKTANLGKNHWYNNKKVIVYIQYYDASLDGWYWLHQSNKVDCTGTAGLGFAKLQTVNYIKVNMRKADNVVWFDLNVWTAIG